ncbi:hypothetical protein ACFYTF_30780 [Nocardia thailandica]|uniref:Acyl-CoA dehydrogenase n=1 Tax=Nocardia thailandica TaxID=257275 RepID=A0ABW6PXQ2_9NOCA
MGDTHAARAEELAAEANEALRRAIETDAKPPNAFAAAGYGGNKWEQVRALQAQAQVHATLAHADATLALAEVVARGGTPLA